jgi:hypothetical protein
VYCNTTKGNRILRIRVMPRDSSRAARMPATRDAQQKGLGIDVACRRNPTLA